MRQRDGFLHCIIVRPKEPIVIEILIMAGHMAMSFAREKYKRKQNDGDDSCIHSILLLNLKTGRQLHST
jgi:hypothetical protein